MIAKNGWLTERRQRKNTRLKNKALYLQGLKTLLLTAIYLVFGFCPLRNTLSAIAHATPANTTKKIPEYGKIIAHDDCCITIVAKAIPTTGRPLSGPPLFLTSLIAAFLLCNFAVGANNRFHPLPVAANSHQLPIYLRNRSLLI
ncbi:hypothetical protein [Mucilaginibacter sp. dw_454]|uniref:hypothetical protein n=1 Tax=Mucilaginibacter sp. dw_454 TaxID=2720079 RepID=UPI001BD5DB21|nr:hypothetical protein [Mucilaginibacter sp. dw_454]